MNMITTNPDRTNMLINALTLLWEMSVRGM
jgi:hypothetical protein